MDSPSIKRKSPESGAGEPMKHVGNVKVEVKQKPNDANEDETVDGDEADRILKRYEEMVKSHEDLSTDKKVNHCSDFKTNEIQWILQLDWSEAPS